MFGRWKSTDVKLCSCITIAQFIVQHIFHFNVLKKLKDAQVHTAAAIQLHAHIAHESIQYS